jgi:hypothetical protein
MMTDEQSAQSAVRQWLARNRLNRPARDLIEDMRHDDDLPSLFTSQHHMRNYLISCNACPEALALVPIVWKSYRRWLDAHPWRTW